LTAVFDGNRLEELARGGSDGCRDTGRAVVIARLTGVTPE
jgi:hypothetical protein